MSSCRRPAPPPPLAVLADRLLNAIRRLRAAMPERPGIATSDERKAYELAERARAELRGYEDAPSHNAGHRARIAIDLLAWRIEDVERAYAAYFTRVGGLPAGWTLRAGHPYRLPGESTWLTLDEVRPTTRDVAAISSAYREHGVAVSRAS